MTRLDFVLALHSHLPWVLNHGRWPHGSDWITEAAIDTYLPLLETLFALEADKVDAPVTIGITPVLANMLAHPLFREELELYFDQRLAACDEAPASLATTGDAHLVPLVAFWRTRLQRLRRLFHTLDSDLVAAFRGLEQRGRIEIISSAATHGFLPLLACDESIRLQLALGVSEHRRLFGRSPQGCWVPECAYRPRGRWAPWPTAPAAAMRRGIDEHLADAGYRYFFIDAHLVTGAQPLGLTSDGRGGLSVVDAAEAVAHAQRSPYRAWQVSHPGAGRSVSVFVRDPRASAQVWSRAGGYPGDGAYLEFHKIRWPGGLRFWRVTESRLDLALKEPYRPDVAAEHADAHARHFARLLDAVAAEQPARSAAVAAAPFDTELFGHWWFEGPHFLEALFRVLPEYRDVSPSTGSAHLERHRPAAGLKLPEGSWGANGDFSMWLSDLTAWTWERLWPLEQSFWDVARDALDNPAAHAVLAQATRELVLAQSSDWQFIISTGAVPDYAFRRFSEHCENAERLIAALRPGQAHELPAARQLADAMHAKDDLFPDPLPAVAAALAGTRSIVVS